MGEGLERLSEVAGRVRRETAKVIIGQERVVDQALAVIFTRNHALIEGVPGVAKTLLTRTLARTLGCEFQRIQFTPDQMPSDITGTNVFNLQTNAFTLVRGPVFTSFLLADEINRAPAKTQSALLEVMQEQQVTIEGRSFEAGRPFMVLATQNPIEHEGTYPLPEAQLDRFLLKVAMDYPPESEEQAMARLVTLGSSGERLQLDPVAAAGTVEDVLELQKAAAQVRVDDQVLAYAVRLARATRTWAGFAVGASPRGSIALVRAARARALLAGRAFATPDDVKALALPALRHRVTPAPESELEGETCDQLLTAMLEQVEAPRA